jgi:hypothetical protein
MRPANSPPGSPAPAARGVRLARGVRREQSGPSVVDRTESALLHGGAADLGVHEHGAPAPCGGLQCMRSGLCGGMVEWDSEVVYAEWAMRVGDAPTGSGRRAPPAWAPPGDGGPSAQLVSAFARLVSERSCSAAGGLSRNLTRPAVRAGSARCLRARTSANSCLEMAPPPSRSNLRKAPYNTRSPIQLAVQSSA